MCEPPGSDTLTVGDAGFVQQHEHVPYPRLDGRLWRAAREIVIEHRAHHTIVSSGSTIHVQWNDVHTPSVVFDTVVRVRLGNVTHGSVLLLPSRPHHLQPLSSSVHPIKSKSTHRGGRDTLEVGGQRRPSFDSLRDELGKTSRSWAVRRHSAHPL
jgi:hypothetical protein